MKIAYFGHDFFYSCLEVVLDQGHELVKLFTCDVDGIYNTNRRVVGSASKHNSDIQLSRATLSHVAELDERCDLVISAGYPFLIPVNKFKKCRGVNIHPSLLPAGRGPWPLPNVILKNLREGGVTIHKLNESFDAGEIILQKSFSVAANECQESLSCKCQIAAAELTRVLLSDFERHWASSFPQKNGEYWKMPTESDRRINWNYSIEKIDQIVRAFGRYDSFARFENKDWLVQKAFVWNIDHNFTPGEIVHKTNAEYVIAASDGFVCLTQFREDL